MLVFVSHNKSDKATARLLASALVETGVNVWFDEWSLRPGDSIVGGIENGLAECDVFVLIWSQHCQAVELGRHRVARRDQSPRG